MRRIVPLAAVALALALLVGIDAEAQRSRRTRDAGTAAPAGNPACIEVTGAAPMFGYLRNHVVTVHNGCDRPAVCEVSTNVDPTPTYTLRIEPRATQSVTTRTGSPAFGFEPRATCHLE